MWLITYQNGITTTMTTKELIAAKARLLAIGADWKKIS